MPIKLDFSNSRDATARIQQFLMYDQLNKRGAQRQQTQSFLEDALMRGREESRAGMQSGLEEQRSENTMKEATHTAMLAISQAPQFDGILSILNLGRMGKLPPGSERLYEDAAERFPKMWEDIANGAYAVSQGTATAEHFAGLIEARGSEAAKWAAQEGGMHLRAREQILVDKERNRIAAAESAARVKDQAGKYSPYEEQTLKRIDVALSHIVGEGVETDNAALQATLNMYRAGTGKATDVYPSDVAGYFKSELDKIKSKIIDREGLTEMEDAFISSTFNVFEARGGYNPGGEPPALPSAKGGIPPGVAAGGLEGGFPSTPRPHIKSPQTGLSPNDEAAGRDYVRTVLIRQNAAEIAILTGVDEATALKEATKYVDETILTFMYPPPKEAGPGETAPRRVNHEMSRRHDVVAHDPEPRLAFPVNPAKDYLKAK